MVGMEAGGMVGMEAGTMVGMEAGQWSDCADCADCVSEHSLTLPAPPGRPDQAGSQNE